MKKFLLIVSVFTLTAVAQLSGPFGQRPMERLESYKKVRMLETLKLEEETALKLISRYDKHRQAIRELDEERKTLIDKLEEKVNAGASDSEFQKLFSELREVEKKIFEARTKYISELKEILTAKQLAEYLIFERNFARDIRDIMRENQKERMRK